MTTTTLELSCRDPIVSRDGRPFGIGQGNRMRSVGWPLPSVVAGSLRTAVGKAAAREFSAATALELLQVAVAGVLPVADGRLYLPAPHDCVVHPEQGPLHVMPQTIDDGGCDLPDGLQPVMLSREQAPKDFKPKGAPAWWPLDRYAGWLIGAKVRFDPSFLDAPEPEQRTHVQLDAVTGAPNEGSLFTTAALPLSHLRRYGTARTLLPNEQLAQIALAVRVTGSGWCSEAASGLDALSPLGGERRLAHWKATTANLWLCPQIVADGLADSARVRMLLATPAIFRDGWKPGWLNDQLLGSPPDSNVILRLVGISIPRWRAVSGWSLAELPNQPRGPKPVRRMVPAGGVYFFEVARGTAAALASRWLEPVSDGEQDRRDGFGLAAWGTW